MTFQKIILNSAQADPSHECPPLPVMNFGKEETTKDKRPCGCGGGHEEPTINAAAEEPPTGPVPIFMAPPTLNGADINHEPLKLPNWE